MALQDLPDSVLTEIFSYVDAVSLCRLGAMRKEFHTISKRDELWKKHIISKWFFAPSTTFTYNEYKRRYLIHQKAESYLNRIIDETPRRTARRLKPFYKLISLGGEAMDIAWEYAHDFDNETATMTRFMVGHGMYCILHSISIYKDLATLRVRPMADPALQLEESAIAVSRMFDESLYDIKQKFDELAEKVRMQSSGASVESKIEALHRVLFVDKEFHGGQFLGDYRNSTLHFPFLEPFQGTTAINLAILYKCVARRIDVDVEIMAWAGYAVARIPALDRYVDVFQKGATITVSDCATLVVRYTRERFEQSRHLSPRSPAEIMSHVFSHLAFEIHQLRRSCDSSCYHFLFQATSIMRTATHEDWRPAFRDMVHEMEDELYRSPDHFLRCWCSPC